MEELDAFSGPVSLVGTVEAFDVGVSFGFEGGEGEGYVGGGLEAVVDGIAERFSDAGEVPGYLFGDAAGKVLGRSLRTG